MFKTQDLEGNALRTLQDAELDVVTGGIAGGCFPQETVEPGKPYEGWSFNSTFVKYVIGRHLPVPI